MDYRAFLGSDRAELPVMLARREERYYQQQRMLKEAGEILDDKDQEYCLICLTLNIAGPYKRFPLSEYFFNIGINEIESLLFTANMTVMRTEQAAGTFGMEYFWSVECDALRCKMLMTRAEESSPYGRLYDIDVIRKNGEKVSRTEIGLGERKCLICGEPGPACARSRKHSVEELQKRSIELMLLAVKSQIAENIAAIAVEAAVREVHTTPKPGLVDENNTGAHSDMTVEMFENSADSLAEFFAVCILTGVAAADKLGEKEPDEAFYKSLFGQLRALGVEADSTMYQITGGVNTHKGLIFSMALLLGSIGLGLKVEGAKELSIHLPDEDVIRRHVSALGKVAVDTDLKKEENEKEESEKAARKSDEKSDEKSDKKKTAGLKLYAAYGLRGIRGEAEDGLPAVFELGLPVFCKLMEHVSADDWEAFNDAGAKTLIRLMAFVDDSNMAARGGVSEALKIRGEVQDYLATHDEITKEYMLELDRELIKKHMSPGGCADLISMIYFIYMLYYTTQ